MTPAAVSERTIAVTAEFVHIRQSLEHAIQRRTRCPETAADLASDMYVKLVRLQPYAETRREAWSYLHRMAHSIAIDYVRAQQRRRELLAGSVDPGDPDVDKGHESAIMARDEMRIVDAALDELPDKCREILMLSRMHGMTHGEIAERMGISRSLIEKYLVRAMSHCRDRLRAVRGETPASNDA